MGRGVVLSDETQFLNHRNAFYNAQKVIVLTFSKPLLYFRIYCVALRHFIFIEFEA